MGATGTASSTISDDEEIPTPSHTIASSSPGRTPVEACPWKGDTFIIRDPESHCAMALRDGVLGLYPEDEYGNGMYRYGRDSYWHCVENEKGWLGFRNAVSGTYIGHNNKRENWKLGATAVGHREWEWFCTRQHPDGGHVLLIKHNDGLKTTAVGGHRKRELVVGQGRGTSWEFIKVDIPPIY